MVSRLTLTRFGPRLPIGAGSSVGSRTIEMGPSDLTILLTLCAGNTGPLAGCAWYMRGLLGSSAAEALLPNHLDVEHSSVNCGSKNAVVKATAKRSPATTVPMPTITRSFLLLGSFTAVALSTSCFFNCNVGRGPGTLFALAQTGRKSTNCRRPASSLRGAKAFDYRRHACQDLLILDVRCSRCRRKLSLRLFGASMLASLLFLPEQGVERVCIWAEFMKITSGSETGELVSAAAFSDTQHAGSSQVPQRG